MGRHKKHRNTISGDYLRSAFFGIEDSLVSTAGLIAGIGAGTQNPKFIILAGLVGVSVEAISMAAGEFLSEETTNELKKSRRRGSSPVFGGLIMFVAYFMAGLLPIIPILLLPPPTAFYASVALTLIGLFVLGLAKGKVTGRSPLRSGLEVLIVGGLACSIGIAVGVYLKIQ